MSRSSARTRRASSWSSGVCLQGVKTRLPIDASPANFFVMRIGSQELLREVASQRRPAGQASMPRSNSRITAAVNSSSSCVHLPFRKGAFSRCAATRAAAVVALPRGFEGTMGRSPRAAAAAADASAAVVGFSSMRDISAAARAASMIVGAGPCKSQARVAPTGSEGSPPRGALRGRGGVSVSSGAGRSLGVAGEFAPDVDCGLSCLCG